MRRIKLYGQLAKLIGQREFMADVATAAEAVRFLLANFPAIEPHMAQQHYRVRIGDRALGADELHEPAGRAEIAIIPVIGGAISWGTIGRIIAGVALIALAFIPGIGALVVPLLIGVGSSLVLGGVAELLTPVPSTIGSSAKEKDINDPRKNYSFSGIQNTSRQGVPVPIVYGECIVGSVVVSSGIDVDQVRA